ncbi:related to aquaporin, Major Intrinsic Protein [Rhynchosporium agropyri]|uniref:Related to aquaporin, Major Intrinsic Protein n=2 Tax=Rhynchosporium TaxID=38037 RepID=A0A1E1LR79_9HELO|nr:related to aquaporin, Major Intrinsic Protein [Rhynchosporium commune]CZT12997.1 related to aquaporin, Major Intrinsic Protein [Rhynchosporium agropyri]
MNIVHHPNQQNQMPVPLSYAAHPKPDFVFPRRPPTPIQYQNMSPMLAKADPQSPSRSLYSAASNHSQHTQSHSNHPQERHPLLSWISDDIRNHMIAMLGEFMGTFSFLFFALAAVQTANAKPDTLPKLDFLSGSPSLLQIMYISFAFGGSLAVNVWVFFRVSGGQFNPAVTFGLCLIGAVPWQRGVLLVPAQLLGAVATSSLVSNIFPGDFKTQSNLAPGVTPNQGMVIEMMLTLLLVFTIMMLAAENHRGSFMAPLGIGIALFIGHMIGINFTGAAINPARSFGPDVVLEDFKGSHWIYYIGPLLGAFVAAGLYKLLKFLEYTTANPGQDDDGLDVYRVVTRPVPGMKRRHSGESMNSLTPLAAYH